MNAAELRDYSEEDLRRRLTEQREKLFQLKFQQGLEQSSTSAETREVRKEIARILTILRERELTPERTTGS